MNFARLIIEVKIDGELSYIIEFVNAQGLLMQQEVKYEWKPIKCIDCNFFEHGLTKCREQQGGQECRGQYRDRRGLSCLKRDFVQFNGRRAITLNRQQLEVRECIGVA